MLETRVLVHELCFILLFSDTNQAMVNVLAFTYRPFIVDSMVISVTKSICKSVRFERNKTRNTVATAVWGISLKISSNT